MRGASADTLFCEKLDRMVIPPKISGDGFSRSVQHSLELWI